jgi:hypothetical protein
MKVIPNAKTFAALMNNTISLQLKVKGNDIADFLG